MIIINNVKEFGSLDRALKVLKKKFETCGDLKKIKEKKEFKKKSEIRREVLKSAQYRNLFIHDQTI